MKAKDLSVMVSMLAIASGGIFPDREPIRFAQKPPGPASKNKKNRRKSQRKARKANRK